MGLDCYIHKKVTDAAGEEYSKELWYGRKENAIHGWMQRHSGIDADDFNCKDLPLTKNLMDEFAADLKASKVTSTGGFFFGGAQDQEDVREVGQKFLTVARQSIAAGEEPYYFSWW